MQEIVNDCPWVVHKPQADLEIEKIKKKPYVCVTAKFYTKRKKFLAAIKYFFAEPQGSIFVRTDCLGEAWGCFYQYDNGSIKRFLASRLMLSSKRKLYMHAEYVHFSSGDNRLDRYQIYDEFADKEGNYSFSKKHANPYSSFLLDVGKRQSYAYKEKSFNGDEDDEDTSD
ncbi:MAG: hypothetical protein K2N84_05935 [Clostridia bacterium]|nr:hypothetical protein [Clostridia bacterium]